MNRRKIAFINKEIQVGFLKLILVFYVFSMLSISIFWVSFLYLMSKTFLVGSSQLFIFINQYKLLIFMFCMMQLIFSASMIYFLFHRFTNKVCGPIFSLHRTLKEILATHTLRNFRIRKDDFYQDLAVDLNKLVTEFSEIKDQHQFEQKKHE